MARYAGTSVDHVSLLPVPRRSLAPCTSREKELSVSGLHLRPAEVYAHSVLICGVPVPSRLVFALAILVDDKDLQTKFTVALKNDADVLGLDIDERETLLDALEDPPEGFERLHTALLNEQGWRRAQGLSSGSRGLPR